jgi:hypothetical protein
LIQKLLDDQIEGNESEVLKKKKRRIRKKFKAEEKPEVLTDKE